jgi:hypothetical protein
LAALNVSPHVISRSLSSIFPESPGEEIADPWAQGETRVDVIEWWLEILQTLGGSQWSPDVGLGMPPSAPLKPWPPTFGHAPVVT